VTDREKTIIDIAHRPELGGGIIQLAEALKTTHNDIDWEKVDQYIERWGGGSVVKRLGYLIETMSIPIPDREAKLKNWRSFNIKRNQPIRTWFWEKRTSDYPLESSN